MLEHSIIIKKPDGEFLFRQQGCFFLNFLQYFRLSIMPPKNVQHLCKLFTYIKDKKYRRTLYGGWATLNRPVNNFLICKI